MVAKPYTWADGANLDDHSRRKHKILREYSQQYLMVRCQDPRQTRFRLAVVDGFSGGGRYTCELTDVDPDTVAVGQRVELTFRRTVTAKNIHNYFWKARPIRGGQ